MNEFEIEFDIKPNEFEIDLENVIKEVYPTLENLEITPSASEQVFNHPDSYGYDEVVVNAIPTEELNITPSKETQSFNGIYNKVEVEAVTSEIDSNIVAENIKNDVEILGVKGTFVGGKYAPKFISFYKFSGTDLDYELQNLDTSNITSMRNSFSVVQINKPLVLDSLDLSKVTTMQDMFNSFMTSQLELRNLNLENLTNATYFLAYSTNIKNVIFSNVKTPILNDTSNMFYGCQKLENLDINCIKTDNVTNMNSMFRNCYNLENLDLSSFNTTNVTNMTGMFQDCSSLKYLDIRNFTFDKVTAYRNMFNSVPTDCEIIVKDDTQRNWLKTNFSTLTNIKTVAEL